MKNKNQNDSTKKNAVIYTRVACSDQVGNPQLRYQEKCIEKFAEANGYNIVDRFGGVFSSNDMGELRRMIEFIKNDDEKIKFVLVNTLDRISRNHRVFSDFSMLLQKLEVKLIIVSDSPNMNTVREVLNHYERKSKLDRKRRRDPKKIIVKIKVLY